MKDQVAADWEDACKRKQAIDKKLVTAKKRI
jgi:hypothetical protein